MVADRHRGKRYSSRLFVLFSPTNFAGDLKLRQPLSVLDAPIGSKETGPSDRIHSGLEILRRQNQHIGIPCPGRKNRQPGTSPHPRQIRATYPCDQSSTLGLGIEGLRAHQEHRRRLRDLLGTSPCPTAALQLYRTASKQGSPSFIDRAVSVQNNISIR